MEATEEGTFAICHLGPRASSNTALNKLSKEALTMTSACAPEFPEGGSITG
jgi:hypothetical protein